MPYLEFTIFTYDHTGSDVLLRAFTSVFFVPESSSESRVRDAMQAVYDK
jgi:hypothetical protein